jgi:hypothetical protein
MRTVQEALRQVQELKQKILEKQRFKGYSGRARAMSGTIALFAAMVLASPYWPDTPRAHLAGWAAVFFLACLLNFGAILYWYVREPSAKQEMRRLRPLIDTLPPLLVGGVMTAGLIRQELWSWLVPVWMALFGLANLASRHVLPHTISIVGWYYILAGGILLLLGPPSFLNPWPMGIIFFAGEWMGGIALHFDQGKSFSDFFFTREKIDVKETLRSTK